MSDLFATLAGRVGFAPDPRFAKAVATTVETAPGDPVAEAFALGYAEGQAEAQTAAELHLNAALASRTTIDLALIKAGTELQEQLRQRLHAAVAALCGEAFAIAARDPDWLARRIAAAATLLARADDGRVLRLHPDDITLLGSALPDLPIEPDLALCPGSLRIEGTSGGVSDGPEVWQRELTEALSQC